MLHLFILIIKNIKKKIAYTCIIAALWILALVLSVYISENNSYDKLSINDHLIFAYPENYIITDVFTNTESAECNASINNIPVNNKITEFSDYESLTGKFSFKYPSVFRLNEQNFSGNEILYHIDFSDSTKSCRGFVQVWELAGSLEEFLKNSSSLSELNCKYFHSKPVLVNKVPGFYWDYAILGSDNIYYKGSEVFFKIENRIYRISYFVPEKKWNSKQENLFWDIVNSFRIIK